VLNLFKKILWVITLRRRWVLIEGWVTHLIHPECYIYTVIHVVGTRALVPPHSTSILAHSAPLTAPLSLFIMVPKLITKQLPTYTSTHIPSKTDRTHHPSSWPVTHTTDAEAEDEKVLLDDLSDSAVNSPMASAQKLKTSARSEVKRSLTPPDGLMSSLGLSSFLRYWNWVLEESY
jgi:hypothetical protein